MDYKFKGLKFGIKHYDEEYILLELEDSVGILFETEDSYNTQVYYSNVFYDECLYNENTLEEAIHSFCKKADSMLRGLLPDYEEFDVYKNIEGYSECMELLKELCKKPLKELWEKENG